MTRRTFGIALAICGLLSTWGFAQDPWAVPPQAAFPSQGPFGPPADSWVAPGVQHAGFHGSTVPGPPNPQVWHHQRQLQSQTLEQLLPEHRLLYQDDTRLQLTLKEALARSWIRLDYLNWDLRSPRNVLLGAPLPAGSTADLSGADPNNLLSAIDRVDGQRPVELGNAVIVPSLGTGSLHDLNGIRGSFGIPTLLGTLEADAWVLEQGTESIRIRPTEDYLGTGLTTIGGTTLLNNGVPSETTMIFFNQNYRARLQTGLFGTEGNWVFNPFTPNVAVEISPMVGFRYVRMTEALTISGQDAPDLNDPTLILNHLIRSRARNHVFGPQIGLRASTDYWRFTLGAETKFFMGINRTLNNVNTQQIFDVDEERQRDQEDLTHFAPMLDLTLSARLRMTERFSLFVAYDLLFGAGFSRAYDNIYYNAPASVNDPPDIRLDSKRSNFYAQGISIGGELFFR